MTQKINIYTDGACSTNGTWNGGAGLFVELPDSEEYYYRPALETTNNVMELDAFNEALRYVFEAVSVNAEVNIYTDSAYIVNCLKQQWYKKWESNGWRTAKKEPVKNKDLWVSILSYLGKTSFHNISVHKIKGHSGDRGNGIADQLAVFGRGEGKDGDWGEYKHEIKELYN